MGIDGIDGNAINQGLIGMQRSYTDMAQSAAEVVHAQVAPSGQQSSTVDIAEPLIDMRVQQQVFDSSARVVQAANDNLGQLLDVHA